MLKRISLTSYVVINNRTLIVKLFNVLMSLISVKDKLFLEFHSCGDI